MVAVQLARARGQRVLGTASERNLEFLRSIGAEPLIYGEGVRERALALAPGGRRLRLRLRRQGPHRGADRARGRPGEGRLDRRLRGRRPGIKLSSGADFRAVDGLAEAAELMREGKLQLLIEETFRFADAAQAHSLSAEGHVRGKLTHPADAGG